MRICRWRWFPVREVETLLTGCSKRLKTDIKPKKRRNILKDSDFSTIQTYQNRNISESKSLVIMRRVRALPQDPNPLFLAWLEEWEEEARSKGKLPLAKIYSHCQKNLSK